MQSSTTRTCPLSGRCTPASSLQQRGLADSAFPGDHGDPAGRNVQPQRADRTPLAGGPDGRAGHPQSRNGRQVGPGSGGRRAGVQDRQHLRRGGDPVGGGMELGAELTQRQVGLRREDQHRQPHLQRQIPVDQPQPDRDGDERDRQGRQQLQHHGRQERDPQGHHGRLAVVVGDAADGLRLRLGPAEHLERGKPRHHVGEVPGQPGQTGPLRPGLPVGVPADQGHEQRDQGQRAGHDQRAGEVSGEQVPQHDQRDHHRQHQLRQVSGDVVVQGFHAAGGQHRQLTAVLTRAPSWTERRGPAQQVAAEPRSHGTRAAAGNLLCGPGEPGPQRDHQRKPGQPAADRGGVLPVDDHVGQDSGDQHGLDDNHDGSGDPEQHGGHQQGAHSGRVTHQPRVERSHQASVTEQTDSLFARRCSSDHRVRSSVPPPVAFVVPLDM